MPTDAVDDVVQEVFVVVHARLKTLERPASLRSWLYGVVRRTVSTYHRARQARSARESSEPFDDKASPMQPSPLDLALLSDELRLLWRLLGELDPVKREVFVLAELEEMTAPEIAEAAGIPRTRRIRGSEPRGKSSTPRSRGTRPSRALRKRDDENAREEPRPCRSDPRWPDGVSPGIVGSRTCAAVAHAHPG